MTQSEAWAHRLVRMMKNPRELLQRRRYRTSVFLRAYLDHVEEIRFRNPREGLKFAKVAPQLALLVPAAAGPKGHREHRENLVRAHCILASAYRSAGQPAVGESEYKLALKIADSEPLSPVARADLSNRLAALRACQRRFAEAIALVDGAAAEYQAAGDLRRLAEAHAMRGYVLNEAESFSEAMQWHGKALKLALRLEREKSTDAAEVAGLARVVESARTNMADAISKSPDGAGLTTLVALEYIRAAERELRGRRDSLTRHVLQWIEGRVWERLNRPDRAETRYGLAQRGFGRLEVPWENALVSLDLAALYRVDERWEELEDLAANTFDRFCELCADFEAIAALSLWVESVEARKGVKAAIAAAREVVTARMARP